MPAAGGGAGGTDTSSILVQAPHATGTTIFPVSRRPLDVYAYTPQSSEVVLGDQFSASDVTLAAWAEIWPTEAEARRAALKPPAPGDWGSPVCMTLNFHST